MWVEHWPVYMMYRVDGKDLTPSGGQVKHTHTFIRTRTHLINVHLDKFISYLLPM